MHSEIKEAILQGNVAELIKKRNRKSDLILLGAILLIAVIFFGAYNNQVSKLKAENDAFKLEQMIECERFKDSLLYHVDTTYNVTKNVLIKQKNNGH
jgi:hypothetical protein